jgi:serine phosphatase RsbU (regulator of sigma subunit)
VSGERSDLASEAATADALDDCEREPIRSPGAIQPRGALLVLDGGGARLVYVSDNAERYLGRAPADALGWTLEELGLAHVDEAARVLAESPTRRPARLRLATRQTPVDTFAHRVGEHLVIELEDVDGDDHEAEFGRFQDDVLGALERFDRAADVATVLETTVDAIRDLTGFERVLVYRFEPDEHGVVVAERHAPRLEPFLGLHYPASDIPAQARALYREQWLRMIPDSSARAVDLVGPPDAPPPSTVDLSGAVLRAVSPVHLQYLRNMGVRASMSVSLVVRDRLWGLIVCHHYRDPRALPYRTRAACEVVGRTASLTLAPKEELATAARRIAVEELSAQLLEDVAHAHRVADGLARRPELLLEIARANGAAIRIDGTVHALGAAPPEPARTRLVELAQAQLGADGSWFASDGIATEDPGLDEVADRASGILAISLSSGADDLIAWFRPERVHTVSWAGDPRKPIADGPGGIGQIGPRRSFATWAETVRGRSLEWDEADVEAVVALRGWLTGSLERRRLYDREHFVAEVIRESLQPAAIPPVPGLDVAALYRPSGEGFGVSGDFYDVVEAGAGWVVAIGDVTGKGPRAARLTALARHTIRAIVLRDPGIAPAALVALLNAAFAAEADPLYATVQIVRITPADSGGAAVSLCSAGHPPALHRHGSSIVDRTSRGALVGTRASLTYRDISFALAPGDSLTLYTDGVTEAGRPGPMFGEDRLHRVVQQAAHGSARSIVEAVDHAVGEGQHGELRDDIAILSVRVPT